MSRISGCVSFSSRPNLDEVLYSMMARFSGGHQESVACSNRAFGWKGIASGGGVAEFDRLCIAIDGRILNCKELTQNFEDTRSDLHLIAQLYRKYGFETMLQILEGDYAIAIYDENDQSLFLGRDRFGVKPLYYTLIDNEFLLFSSQPSSILDVQAVDRSININFAARFIGLHYRTFDNSPHESPYASVQQLPASHMLAFKRDSTPKVVPYWILEELDEWEGPAEDLSERYRDLLMKSVGKRVAVTENSAFTLSGGLDSSSVLCCASEVEGQKQTAFSSVYADPTYDERNEIKDVVDERVDRWVPVELGDDIDVFNIVREMVSIHDEPVATATWLSHFLLTRQVSEDGFTALFGGLGGDELNAGEYEYFPMYFADLRLAGKEGQLDKEIQAWADYHDHPIHKKNRLIAEEMISDMACLDQPGRCLPNISRMMRYSSVVSMDVVDLSGFSPVMDEPFSSFLKNRTYQDIARETLPCCLRAEDRQCTAAGLEHFDPFLDHKLVEFMFRVPGELKIRNGVTKQLLRTAMKGVLPDATRNRIAKTGWNAPAHKWFSGETLSKLRDVVSSTAFINHGLFNSKEVARFINDHERIVQHHTQEESHMMFLWQLLNMVVWLELDH